MTTFEDLFAEAEAAVERAEQGVQPEQSSSSEEEPDQSSSSKEEPEQSALNQALTLSLFKARQELETLLKEEQEKAQRLEA